MSGADWSFAGIHNTTGEQIVKIAFADFDCWCRAYDPDGDMGIMEQIDAYYRWALRVSEPAPATNCGLERESFPGR